MECYTGALALNPFFVEAVVGRGNVYMDFVDEENREKARRDYERALHINPHFLPARCNLAFSLQVSIGGSELALLGLQVVLGAIACN